VSLRIKLSRDNASLSDGKTVKSTIRDVPPPIDLTNAAWHLAAEDWQPANPYATTLGVAATETRKVRVATTLNNRLAALDETVKRPSGLSQRGRPPE
jgi:hypothetical protein